MSAIMPIPDSTTADVTPAGGAESRPGTCVAPGFRATIRLSISTPQEQVLDVTALEVVVDDRIRPLTVRPACRPFVAALTGGVMIVRTAAGLDVRLEFGWGTLASDGAGVRVSTSVARLHNVIDPALDGSSGQEALSKRPTHVA